MGRLKIRKGIRETSREELWLFAGVVGFLLLIGVLALWYSVGPHFQGTVVEAGTDLRIPLEELEEGELHLFTYALDSSTGIEFVAQRDPDGIIRVAFASCRRCAQYRHLQRGEQIICGHCGHAMAPPDSGQEPTGDDGCIPVALRYVTERGTLLVKGETIRQQYARWYNTAAETQTAP